MTRPAVLCIFCFILPACGTWLESIPKSRLSLVGREAVGEKADSGGGCQLVMGCGLWPHLESPWDHTHMTTWERQSPPGSSNSWPVFLQVILDSSLQVTKLVLILIVSRGRSHVPRISLEYQLFFKIGLMLVRGSWETYSLPEADLVYFFRIFSI